MRMSDIDSQRNRHHSWACSVIWPHFLDLCWTAGLPEHGILGAKYFGLLGALTLPLGWVHNAYSSSVHEGHPGKFSNSTWQQYERGNKECRGTVCPPPIGGKEDWASIFAGWVIQSHSVALALMVWAWRIWLWKNGSFGASSSLNSVWGYDELSWQI